MKKKKKKRKDKKGSKIQKISRGRKEICRLRDDKEKEKYEG